MKLRQYLNESSLIDYNDLFNQEMNKKHSFLYETLKKDLNFQNKVKTSFANLIKKIYQNVEYRHQQKVLERYAEKYFEQAVAETIILDEKIRSKLIKENNSFANFIFDLANNLFMLSDGSVFKVTPELLNSIITADPNLFKKTEYDNYINDFINNENDLENLLKINKNFIKKDIIRNKLKRYPSLYKKYKPLMDLEWGNKI